MTDIYVKNYNSSSRKGCIIGIAVIFIVLTLGFVIWSRTGHDQEATEPQHEASKPDRTDITLPEPTPVRNIAGSGSSVAGTASSANFDQARRLADNGHLLEARDMLEQIVAQGQGANVDSAMQLLGEINTTLIFSPRQMPEKIDYTVQPGDTLGALAKEYDTTVNLIRKGNNISGSTIRIADRLRIFTGRFSMTVDKKENLLDLYCNGKFFKRYPVGTGKYDKTPVGEFKITDRIAQPTWWRPDGKAIPYGSTNNVLGTHWLSLDIKGYGLHGTWEPETIGHQASAGCVRMHNNHIEELYTLIPIGTPVTITD